LHPSTARRIEGECRRKPQHVVRAASDPDLVLDDGWVKIFTILYQLIGIGILVEILRRLGLSFVEVRRQESQPARRSPPEHP
jgi:hypothetical protein